MDDLKFEVHVCEHCNLNCKGCYHFSPLAKKEFLDTQEWERDCERLSYLFDGRMEFISLMGGEPLLHPEICRLLEISRKAFPVGDVSIITNGILLPRMSQQFWDTCKEYNVSIRLTKYPVDLDFDAIERKALEENVRLLYFNKGIKTLGRQPLDLTGAQPAESNFRNCYRNNTCIAFSHGKLYSCFIPAHIHHLNSYFNLNIELFEKDGIDIYDVGCADDIKKHLTKPMETCRYCIRNMCVRDGMNWAVSEKELKEWVERE